MKKLILLLVTLVMCFGFSTSAFAEEIEDNNDYSHELIGLEGTEKLERWSYTNSTSQILSVSSGTATFTASVTGYSSKATKIVMYMYLQQSTSSGGWTNLASYTHTFNTYHGAASHTYSVPSGYTYRLRCSYYVYSGSEYEHIIAYSGTKTY